MDARHLGNVKAHIAHRPLQDDHLALGPSRTGLEPHQGAEIDQAGDAALLVHHPEQGRRRPRHPADEAHLRHPPHRRERDGVAVASMLADDGSRHGHSSLKRETTVCNSTERLVSSCAEESIEAVTAACSRMVRETCSVLLALPLATSRISRMALTISSLPASWMRAASEMAVTRSLPAWVAFTISSSERMICARSSRP